MKTIRALMFLLIMLIFLLVSCEESVKMEVGSITIEEPIVSLPTEKALVPATLQIDEYRIMMIPQWEEHSKNSYQIVGSTKGLNKDKDPDYITYDPNVKRYYSQGVWTFGLKALSDGKTVYTVGPKTVEINSFNTTIKISPDEIVPAVTSGVSSVTIQNFDFLLVDSPENYGSTYGSTYYVQAKILPLNGGTGINAVTSTKGITFNDNIGTIVSFTFDGSVGNGAYNLNLSLYEIVNENPKKTGTVSCAFISVPGVDIIIQGDAIIDLYPSYYFDSSTDGESDITVDDGSVSNSIVLTVKNSSGILPEKNGIKEAGATDTLTVSVKDDPNSSNYLWLINGSPVTGGIDKSNKSLSIPASSYKGKIICITYMILGNSNLSKQSENVYVKIT